jgi:hypothetical protein
MTYLAQTQLNENFTGENTTILTQFYHHLQKESGTV